jgi:hypothetical protein
MYGNDVVLYDQVAERIKDFQREAQADRLAKSTQSAPRSTVFYRLAQNAAAHLKWSGRRVEPQHQPARRSVLALQNRS